MSFQDEAFLENPNEIHNLEELVNLPTFKIQGKIYKGNVLNDLKVDLSNLEHGLESQTILMLTYSFAADAAAHAELEAKNELKRLFAILYVQCGTELAALKQKTTKDNIESAVMLNADYVKLQKEYHQLKHLAAQLKSVVAALSHRKDMLVTASANMRSQAHAERTMT